MGISRVSVVSIILAITIVILLTAVYFYPSEKNEYLSSYGWRMVYGNPQGNCLSGYNISNLTGRVLWIRNMGSRIIGLLEGGDGKLYLLSNGKIISMNGNGKILWEVSMNFSSITPAIDEYGNIYAATTDGRILSLNENGKVRWIFHFPGSEEKVSSPLIVQNRTLYILTTMGNLYMVSYDGNLIAKVNLGHKTSLPPVVSSNGEVYVGANNTVYIITSAGKVMRKVDLNGEIIRMAIYGKKLYITTLEVKFSPYPVVKNITPNLFALSNEGNVKWRIDLNTLGAKWGVPSSLAVDENAIYVGIEPSSLPSGREGNKT